MPTINNAEDAENDDCFKKFGLIPSSEKNTSKIQMKKK